MQMFPTDTIAQTKLRLSQITGFNPTQIKLRNDEEELLDYNQIQQYNINNEIYLSIVNLEGIIIHVKTIPFGKKISLVLDPSESIS